MLSPIYSNNEIQEYKITTYLISIKNCK